MCRTFPQLIWISLLSSSLLVGCTPKQYSQQADRSAYAALGRAQKTALGGTTPFSVGYRPFRGSAEGDGTISVAGKVIHLAGEGELQKLTLDECLEIAFRNSRDFQDRVEDLYSDALALANTRRAWDIPLFEGDIDASADYKWERFTETETFMETEANVTVTKDRRVLRTPEDKSTAVGIGLEITQRLIHGGVLTLAATVDWATDFLSGGGTNVVSSLFEANFTQPLLRGAWRGFAYEDQYRLARDFLFAVFEYERFRQTFGAGILNRYYSVLRQRDSLQNERSNIKRLKQTFAVTRVKVEGGQVSRIQQDQAEQDLLNAQVRAELIEQQYQNALDRFKIELGLPIYARVELDYPRALEEVAKTGLKPIGFAEAEAIAIALSVRPDVLREFANVRDADRNVEIAADQFNPQLDVELEVNTTGSEPWGFQGRRLDKATRFAGITFDYDLDQTDNRDSYRLSMIAYDKARRDLDEFLDNVRLEVRQSYRDLMQSKTSYELQERSVRIALRRRKLASLQQQEGQASARDVLEAEDALRNAQNGRTRALVDYTTTRVQFLATLGLIGVNERGLLYERKKPFRFDRIRQRYPYVSDN